MNAMCGIEGWNGLSALSFLLGFVSWGLAPGWNGMGRWPKTIFSRSGSSFPSHPAIVTEIEAEQALVAANRELITRFEKKIQATLARVWGEEF
jgi:hypothetical protein